MQLLSWEAGHLNTHATCCTSPYCLAQGYLRHASAPRGLLMRPPRHSLPAALWQTGHPLSDPALYRTSESCLKGPPHTAKPLNPHTMQWAGKAVTECHRCLCARFLWTLSTALRASMLQGGHLDLQACHELGRRDKGAPPVWPGRRCVGHLPLSRCLSGMLITTLTG